jgi:hypothetical protein
MIETVVCFGLCNEKERLFEARTMYICNCVCVTVLAELINMLFHFKLIYCGVMLTLFGKGKGTPNRLESPEGRGTVLHSLDLGARRGWVVSTTLRPLYPQERLDTHCKGGFQFFSFPVAVNSSIMVGPLVFLL